MTRKTRVSIAAAAVATIGSILLLSTAAVAADNNSPAVKAPATAAAEPKAGAPADVKVAAPAAPAVSPTTNAAAKESGPLAGSGARAAADTNFVVEVDGAKLMQADADARVAQRIARVRDRVPADRIPQMEKALQPQVVEEFILQTLITGAAAKQGVKVTDADITQFIEENIKPKLPPGTTLAEILKRENVDEAELRKDVRLQVTIKKLVDADLGPKAEPTDKEVTDFYEKQKDQMKVPETVHARHILISTKQDEDAKAKAEKKAKAEDLRKQLAGGADFAKVAEENSDDPGSKARGGDLGTFRRGQMVKEFEKIAFNQKTNAISPVFETDYGYHILQVLEHGEARTMPFEEAKPQIKKVLVQQAQQEAFESLVDKLKQQAKIVYGSGAPPAPSIMNMR